MLSTPVGFALVSLVPTALAQAPRAPINLDFEADEPGSPTGGWFAPPALAESYRIELVVENAKVGKRCALIASRETRKPDHFGNLMQSFDARPYRGHRVRFRAAVRAEIEGRGSRAQLWLRVDRQGQPGFFDNMADRPITGREWGEYEITGDVADDAMSIHIGCMLFGDGKVWVDAASFDVAGRSGEGDEPARPLEGRALDNLVAFTRLLGYVRHFHPSDGAAAADWHAFAIEGVRAVEGASSAAELARVLEDLFRPPAPSVQVFPVGERPAPHAGLSPPKETAALEVTAWRHLGLGGELIRDNDVYSSRRDRLPAPGGKVQAGFPDPSAPFEAELGGGVACRVPLALFADERGTLPRDTPRAGPVTPATRPAAPRPPGFIPSGNDRATRLAAVAVAWNVFQHFYPYFDVVEVDWPRSLREGLEAAATDIDQAAFVKTLRRLVARLEDGHGYVRGQGVAPAGAVLPLAWDWVEAALVVTALAEDYEGRLELGDVIRGIDGRAAEAVLSGLEELISGATPQWRRARALRELASGEPGSRLVLDVESRSGERFTETLVRSATLKAVRDPRPEPIAEVRPGIFYVDLERVTDATFGEALPRLEKARGIVIDLRTYPNNVSPAGVLAHFLETPVTCAQWHVPKVERPDREGMEFVFSNWSVLPASPRLRAKSAYITGGGAISYSETWLGIIEHYKLAAIVGGPTAGTNGNVNVVGLPGRLTVNWTGMKVLKHDGSRHHGVGIQPTVPFKRTIKGIADGRDELLERAIEEVSS